MAKLRDVFMFISVPFLLIIVMVMVYLESQGFSSRTPLVLSATVAQFGQIKSGHRYAVFSSPTRGSPAVDYIFDLPMSAKAWKRIGYDSIIIMTNEPDRRHAWARYVLDLLIAMDHVVVIILKDVPSDKSTMLGQVSRLFAPFLVRHHDVTPAAFRDIYVITADADVWPIQKSFFDLPPDKDILRGQIGQTTVAGLKADYVPLSYIGMRVRTWIDVMTVFNLYSEPKSVPDLTRYVLSVFGYHCCDNITHGGGKMWFIDQKLISLRIHQWQQYAGSNRTYVYTRNYVQDRIDRSHWPRTDVNLTGVVDVHLLKKCYKPREWIKLKHLLTKMYPEGDLIGSGRYPANKSFSGQPTVSWFQDYYQRFGQLLNNRSGSPDVM